MLYFNMESGELSDTDEAICNYVARKSEPESWNGDEESHWCLDRQPEMDYFGFGLHRFCLADSTHRKQINVDTVSTRPTDHFD